MSELISDNQAKILPTCFVQGGLETRLAHVKTDNLQNPQNNMTMLSYVRFTHDL